MSATSLNPDRLRAKYREERDRRLVPQQNEQWVEVTGRYAHYIDDPYVEPGFTRPARKEEVEVVVVGGGWGGMLAAAKLHEAGIESFRIIEKAGDFGGTWYWNRYPGAQCDVESYIYMPLLEETGYIPTEKYAHSAEIYAHAQRIGKHFGLYERALFQTQVTGMRWDEAARRWIVTTDREDEIRARFVISASGPLNRPKLPGIKGIDSFRGHTFHTSRWDYDYTGGNNRGGLTKLADKRVAVIGTGATAVQCVPYVAASAKHLYVVQRTPSTVDVRGNHPTDPEWAKSLKPGWQRRRTENFNVLVSGGIEDEDLVHDGWTDIFRILRTEIMKVAGSVSPEELARLSEIADFRKGDQVRARVDSLVKDPKTAEKLKAWYYMLCKRPTFNDDYLPAFNRPNVTLIDTLGRGLDRITEKGIIFDGVEHEVDCIIFATGFEVGTGYTRRAAYEVHGVGGRTLSEAFADGMKTFHGFYSHGFPNYFILGLSQNSIKVNVTDGLTEHAEHLVGVLTQMREKGLTRVEPTAEAQAEWQNVILEKSAPLRTFLLDCTPGYYNGEGNVKKGVFVETYGAGPLEFTELLKSWNADGRMAGLALS